MKRSVRFLVVMQVPHCRACNAIVWKIVGKAAHLDVAIRQMLTGPYLRHIVVAPPYHVGLGDLYATMQYPFVQLREQDIPRRLGGNPT